MTKSRLIGLGIGVVLIAAAVGLALFQGTPLTTNTAAALAQAPATPTPGAPSSAPNQKPPAQNTFSDIANAFWNSLASKLGLTVDTLKSDVTSAEKAAIEQAVTDGKLTRAQADRMEQRLNSNAPLAPLGFGRFGPGFRRVPTNGNPPVAPRSTVPFPFLGGFLGNANELEAVANALNMKPADLTAQIKSGKTLAQIATAQNVDQTTVKQAIIDAVKAQLAREVQDGIITQAQADRITANLTLNNIDLTRLPFRGGMRFQRPNQGARPVPGTQTH